MRADFISDTNTTKRKPLLSLGVVIKLISVFKLGYLD